MHTYSIARLLALIPALASYGGRTARTGYGGRGGRIFLPVRGPEGWRVVEIARRPEAGTELISGRYGWTGEGATIALCAPAQARRAAHVTARMLARWTSGAEVQP